MATGTENPVKCGIPNAEHLFFASSADIRFFLFRSVGQAVIIKVSAFRFWNETDSMMYIE